VLSCHRRDPGTELAPQRGQRVRGVLDSIVQDRRAQHLIVDLARFVEPREDGRDRYRVANVRITAAAHLALMAPSRDITGPRFALVI
jgi:hypothetical protein